MKAPILSLDRRQRDLMYCLVMEPMLSHTFDLQAYCALHSKFPGEIETAAASLKLNFTSSREWQSYFKEAQGRQLPMHEQKLGSRRLGLYFESLLEVWLKDSCYFKIIASHVALHDKTTKQTLGEIDWLLENQETHELEHWECAVKYFLAQPQIDNLYGLRGTGLKDTLGTKLNHIITHQLPQSLSPQFAEVLGNKKIAKHVCLIKGMLFFDWSTFKTAESLEPLKLLSPAVSQFLNMNTHFSYWLGEPELEQYLHPLLCRHTEAGALFCVLLERLEWISPLNHFDVLEIQQHARERIYSWEALADWVSTCNSSHVPQAPVMVAVIGCTTNERAEESSQTPKFVELDRFFLVTEEWRKRFQNATFP